jgi:DMSO/TMAO reductase YedYZ heme-binding membrane subunit
MSNSMASLPPTVFPRAALTPVVRAAAVATAPAHVGAQHIAAGVFAAALGYALLRYVGLGSVAAVNAPAYVLNKALAVSGLVLLALCSGAGPLAALVPALRGLPALRKSLGLTGFALSAVHALLTAGLFSPAYYGKLFQATGKLTVWGELAFTSGVTAMALLVLPALTSFAGIRAAMDGAAWKRAQTLSVAALWVGGVHVAAMGWKTWTQAAMATWPGGLPPLTLLSFAVAVTALAVRGIARR